MTFSSKVCGHDRLWGEVIEDEDSGAKVYVTKRSEKHFCWKHRGYGIQYDLFQALERTGVDEIRVVTPDATFISPPEIWSRKGTIDVLRFEDGEQIFLPNAMQSREVKR